MTCLARTLHWTLAARWHALPAFHYCCSAGEICAEDDPYRSGRYADFYLLKLVLAEPRHIGKRSKWVTWAVCQGKEECFGSIRVELCLACIGSLADAVCWIAVVYGTKDTV